MKALLALLATSLALLAADFHWGTNRVTWIEFDGRVFSSTNGFNVTIRYGEPADTYPYVRTNAGEVVTNMVMDRLPLQVRMQKGPSGWPIPLGTEYIMVHTTIDSAGQWNLATNHVLGHFRFRDALTNYNVLLTNLNIMCVEWYVEPELRTNAVLKSLAFDADGRLKVRLDTLVETEEQTLNQ